MVDKGDNAAERLQPSAVDARRGMAKGGEQRKAAALAAEIPLASGTQMVNERLIVAFGNNPDIRNTGIDHIGEHKVNQPVTSPKRYAAHSARLGDFGEHMVMHIGKDNSQCLFTNQLNPSFLKLKGRFPVSGRRKGL